MRYHADGTVNSSFGTDGILTIDVNGQGSDDFVKDLLIDPSGRIIFVGASEGNLLVGRFHSDGSPDSSFNGGQPLLLDLSPNGFEGASAVALDQAGKLLVAGRVNSSAAVVRLTTEEKLDHHHGRFDRAHLDLGTLGGDCRSHTREGDSF